jgi:hypothetical protein
MPGYAMLASGLALIAISGWLAYTGFDVSGHSFVQAWFALPAIIIAIAILKGLVVLQPNESLVCLLFGSYVGTEHRPGFWWSPDRDASPFRSGRRKPFSRQ